MSAASTQKVCKSCGEQFFQREKEESSDFKRRTYCGKSCAVAGRARARRKTRETVQYGTRSDLTASEIARFYSKLAPPPGDGECRLWQGGDVHPDGYGQFTYYVGGKRMRLLAHRVAYTLAGNALAENQVLRHSCDNPPCVNLAHLKPGTQADNIQDAVDRGRLDIRGLHARHEKRTQELQASLERGVRRCTTCREELPLEDFYRSRNHPGGRGYTCRSCESERSKRRAQLRGAA